MFIMNYVHGTNRGHWDYPYKFDPKDYNGFLYLIENRVNNMLYIGKKQFYHGGKKRSKTYGKEMAWRTYVGSSSHVKKDIQKYGKENFSFEIVDLYRTKGGLYYAEAYLQMVCECMTSDKFYNKQIAAIRFVPKEDLKRRTRSYVNKIKKRIQ